MPQKRERINFPLKGISENYGFSVQEEMTCRDNRNMRTRDPRTGRLRGAQRAGLGAYAGGNQLNGSNRVLALGATSSALTKLSFTANTTGTQDWDNAGKSYGDIADMRRSLYDSYVAVTSNNQVYVFNEDGGVVHEIELPETDPDTSSNDRPFASCVAMDEFQNIFVGTTHAGNGAGVDCSLYVYRYNEDDTYLHVFTLDFEEAVLDVTASKNRLYVLTATDPKENTTRATSPAPGDDSYKTYFRLRVFEDYLPFNEVPVETDELRYSYGFQTQDTQANQGGDDSWYYTNDQNVGRLSVSDDGVVMANIASMDGVVQEWGACLWLQPNATEDATDLIDAEFVSVLGLYDGADATTSGVGLEGQWTIGSVDNLDTAVTCGDPFASQTFTFADVSPNSLDAINLTGTGRDGTANCTLRLSYTGSSATPAFVSFVSATNTITFNVAPSATGETNIDRIVDWREAAESLSVANGFNKVPNLRAVKLSASTLRVTGHGGGSAHVDISNINSYATPTGETSVGPGVNVRRMVAERTTSASQWQITGTGTFTQDLEGEWGTATPQSALIRFGQDQNHNCYIPWGRSSSDSTYNSKGVLFFPGEYSASDQEQFVVSGYSSFVSAAAAPLDVPDYYDDANLLHTPFVITAGPRNTSTGEPGIRRHNIVSLTQSGGAPRDVHVVGVAGTKVVKITSSGPQDPDGNSVISATAKYVHITSGYERCYIADGVNYFEYDPTDTDASTHGAVKRLRCSTMGAIPQRCKLVEMWHGRLVLARDPADPGRWSMSAINDVTDWDYFPQIPSAKQACSSTNTRAGRVPDIINAIAVYSDDLLLFGGDRSIWQLSGDPMSGGMLDLVTDETGMAFGRPYCKDPQGTLWFFGSTGGLFYMVPGQRPRRASVTRVEKALRSIDLGNYYVELQWNPIDEGVHIFVIPYGDGDGTLVDHWFYEVNADAWHKDRFGLTSSDDIQPAASVRIDGDLYNDRTLLIGGEDGRVRRWGVDSSGNVPKNDEVTTTTDKAIDSYVLMGPLVQAPISAAQLTEASFVLADDQHGCNYEFFSNSTPDSLGDAVKRGRLKAGRNDRHLVRVSGDHVYMRLRNANVDQTWAFEAGSVTIASAGDLRS